jgi:mitogen-activated protein kinase 7
MHYPGKPFEECFRFCENAQAIDLLEKMLKFDPRKRLTVEECLQHPYMAELHQESDEPKCKR